MNDGLYYADAIELQPINAGLVQAQYTKVFFSDEKCPSSSRLVQLRLPLSNWEILGPVQINDKTAHQVNVTFVAGAVTGRIFNSSKVKETADAFEISFGNASSILPIQKQTERVVQKELSLLEAGKLFFSDTSKPLGSDGFPTALQLEDYFQRH